MYVLTNGSQFSGSNHLLIYLSTRISNIQIMKKNILAIIASGVVLLSACGPSAEERAAEQKRIQDSIAQAAADSIAAVEAARAAEQQRIQDSIAAVMEQMRQDSIKMAEEMAKMKKGASKPKPKPEPKKEEPKKEGSLKGQLGVQPGTGATTDSIKPKKLKDQLK